MLKEQLLNDLKNAMKEKDDIKKNTVQLIRAAILQIEKDKGIDVTDEMIIDIIAKEVKKRKDAAVQFEQGGRNDLLEQNNKEMQILTTYLPKQLSKEEIEEIVKNIISEVGATSMKEMGIVMKEAKAKIGAGADGKTINEVVKALLN